MTEPLALRIHINEPWDFERFNGRPNIEGVTLDHSLEEHKGQDEWVVKLDAPFELHEVSYDEVLISPLYVGEHMTQLFHAIVGFSVRIAHRREDEDGDWDWHYAMTGAASIRRDNEKKSED